MTYWDGNTVYSWLVYLLPACVINGFVFSIYINFAYFASMYRHIDNLHCVASAALDRVCRQKSTSDFAWPSLGITRYEQLTHTCRRLLMLFHAILYPCFSLNKPGCFHRALRAVGNQTAPTTHNFTSLVCHCAQSFISVLCFISMKRPHLLRKCPNKWMALMFK